MAYLACVPLCIRTATHENLLYIPCSMHLQGLVISTQAPELLEGLDTQRIT